MVAFFLAAVFALKMPSFIAQSMTDIVSGKSFSASATSFASIAALNFFIAVFTRDLLAVLISFLFSEVITLFFADLIFGIFFSSYLVQ